jgi:GT2 family glycosyltransferase
MGKTDLTLPKVAIIVLNWNRKDDTLACLESLSQLDYDPFEVIVIDNGSTDGSVQAIQERFSAAKILETGKNLGYAEGNNQGALFAQSTDAAYFLFLNNDTVVSRESLKTLIDYAQSSPSIGAVGPKIFYFAKPTTIWSAGGEIDWKHYMGVMLGYNQIDNGGNDQVRKVDYLVGTCLLIKREIWERLGGFDKNYFMYWEELDWCIRAVRSGYELLYIPQAQIWHKISPTAQEESPFYLYYMTRNRILLFNKFLPRSKKILFHFAHCKSMIITSLRYLQKRKYNLAKAIIKGLLDFYLHRFGFVAINY